MDTFNLAPTLPADHPHRDRVLRLFGRVAASRIGQACRAALLGPEVAELAVRGEALTEVSLMDAETPADRKLSFVDAVVVACDLAAGRHEEGRPGPAVFEVKVTGKTAAHERAEGYRREGHRAVVLRSSGPRYVVRVERAR